MRNASEKDLSCLSSFCMYQVVHPWFGEFKAHVKDTMTIDGMVEPLLVETTQGSKVIVERDWLRAVPRKQGTPAKAKRKPQKGTKPWLAKFEYVDYDPNLMSPGVKVMCRDKKVRVVVGIEYFNDGEHVIVFSGGYTVFLHSGKAYYGDRPWCSDIMKILVEKKIEKTVNDNYCWYSPNVWYFWQGKSSTPPVDANTIVQIWCRGYTADRAEHCLQLRAGYWWWKWDNTNSDIIAFRIVG